MNHWRKSLIYGLSLALSAGFMPIQVYAEETEPEVITEEVSEEPEIIEEELPEEIAEETEEAADSIDESAETEMIEEIIPEEIVEIPWEETPQPVEEGEKEALPPVEPMDAGKFDGAENISLNTEKTASVGYGGQIVYYRFTPSESAYYTISSSAEYGDPYVQLYTADGAVMNEDDDGGTDMNFRMPTYLSASRNYYFGVRFYSANTTGIIPVRLIKGGAVFSFDNDYYNSVAPGDSLTLRVNAVGETSKTKYQWYKDGSVLSGKTGSQLDLNNINQSGLYSCHCDDGYGFTDDIEYYVYVNNHLMVEAVGSQIRTVSLNDSVTLQIKITADDKTGMKIEWYERVLNDADGLIKENLITGASTETYSVSKVTHTGEYIAKVTDRYGNQASMYFRAEIPNHLSAEMDGDMIRTVTYNGSVTLKLKVSADDKSGMKYAWYAFEASAGGEVNNKKIGSSASLSLKNVKESYVIECIVTDRYGNHSYVYYYIQIDNKLSAQVRGGQIISVIMYGTAYINIDVSALDKTGIVYEWYREEYNYEAGTFVDKFLAQTNTGSYTLANIQKSGPVHVIIRDRFGNTVELEVGINIIQDYQIALRKAFLYLEPGKSETLIADGEPHKNWSVMNSDIATVDQNGKVTVKKLGWTVVYCYDDDHVYGSSCQVRGVFSDVKNPSAFYFNPVYWAFDNNITTGTSATTFSPNETCSRAQIVTFLWRMKGSPKVDYNVKFKDVTKDKYFYDAVAWAASNGITTGTSATTFSPNESCTRGQIVTFLWRAMGEPSPGPGVSFTDTASDKYYYNAVCWAFNNNVTTGTSDTTFSPNEKCTRAQAVTFMNRAWVLQ